MAVSKRFEEEILKYRERNVFITNTDLVHTVLKNNIVSHKIPPGSRLNQEQIAKDLDVSRTPVRDALQMLEKEGFLERSSQGYIVYEMKQSDYLMLLDLRIAIEKLAIKLACSRTSGLEKIKMEKNLQETAAVLDAGKERAWDKAFNICDAALAKKLLGEMSRLDREFHWLIIYASHNDYVIEAYKQLDPTIHFFRNWVTTVSASHDAVKRHNMIFESAVIMRDEEFAEKRMQTHLELTTPRNDNSIRK